MYEDSIRIIPEWKHYFGDESQFTEKQIINELKKFDHLAVFHMCAMIILYLSAKDALSTKKQVEIATELFDLPTRQRLQNYIENEKEPAKRYALVYHFPVMLLLRLNLEYNGTGGMNVSSPEEKRLFSKLLVSIMQIWNHQKILGNMNNAKLRRQQSEEIRVNHTQQFLQDYSNEDFAISLTRGRQLLDYARADKRLDFDTEFKAATGMELSLYMDMLLIVMLKWVNDVELSEITTDTIRNVRKYFEQMTFTPDEIDRFLSIVGFNIEDYRKIHENDLQLINMAGDTSLRNIITFMKKPILRYEENFLCISPTYLTMQATNGPYNIIREHIKANKEKSALLPKVWGDAYEKYVVERLKSIYGDKVYTDIKSKDGNASIDALIDDGDIAILVEIKYPHWRYSARITGRRKEMRPFMHAIASYNPYRNPDTGKVENKRKGLGQIRSFIEKVDSGKLTPPFDLSNKALLPMLVLGEEFPFDPFNRQYLEAFAEQQGCIQLKDSRILPFVVLSSEEVEILEHLKEEHGHAKMRELLISHVKELSPRFRKERILDRTTTFKNVVFQRTEIKKSSHVVDAAEKALKETYKYFKPEYRKQLEQDDEDGDER